MHAGELLLLWFAAAVTVEVASSVALLVWLRRQGTTLRFGLTGIPGYLERAYLATCRRRQRSPRRILILRALSIANAAASIVAVISILVPR